MRRLRWVLPVVILAISAALIVAYQRGLAEQERTQPNKPAPIPEGLSAKANTWSISHDDSNGKKKYQVRAGSYHVLEQEGTFELMDVTLDLYDAKDQKKFDRVTSAKALFNPAEHVMFSEGEVEITMGVTEGEEPSGKLLSIKSSGVRLEANTGKVTTDKAASFKFDRGDGKAVGATYDPNARELHLRSEVELHWTATEKPMTVQAGELTYKEAESKVFLGPWSKLLRDKTTLEAANSEVKLDKGIIRELNALQAKGTEQQPKQRIEYAADELQVRFDDKGEVSQISGSKNARLMADSAAAITNVNSDRVELTFIATPAGSELRQAVTNGHSVVENRTKPVTGKETPPTRVLKTDVVELNMKPGGEEIKTILTHTPGTLEFLPNAKTQRKRRIAGDRMTMDYGAKNQLEQYRVVQAATRTEPLDPKKDAPLETWSKDLLAKFDPQGELTDLEQWNEFRFVEGTRKGKADKAYLQQKEQLITLQGQARVADETVSTEANMIVLNQQTEDFTAEGKVYSTRIPDKKKGDKPATGMLSGQESMQARANRMTSTQKNDLIRYIGDAVLWQGSDRIKADEVEIRRKDGQLKARGQVFSQFQDKAEESAAKNAGPSTTFTVVRAKEMDYNDKERIAIYRQDVQLERPGLKVKSKELRAFFVDDANGGSKVDRAVADGSVAIDQEAKGRRRLGNSEHAEYMIEQEKITLEGGTPTVVDSVKGTTKGRKLTLLSKEDRLIVEGEPTAPVVTRLKKAS